MDTRRLLQLLGSLLIVELVATRTIVHHKTTTITNGDNVTKTWTTSHEDDSELRNPFSKSTELLVPQATVQISPQTEIIRIGGSNIPIDELVKQTRLVKGMDPDAITELLNTKQPVVRTKTNDDGQKSTTTLTLEPDGSILCKTVTEPKVEALNPSSTYWSSRSNYSPHSIIPKIHFSSSRSGIDFESNADKWPSFEDYWKPQASTIRTPVTWEPKDWNTGSTYSSNLPKLPDLSHINSERKPTFTFDERLKHPIDSNVDSNVAKTTTTYTYEPTTWSRTYNWTSFSEPTDDFWKSSPFDATFKASTTTPSSIGQSPVPAKPSRTINIEDLPVTGILNNNDNPNDKNLFTTHIWPETSINPFKIHNIPENTDWQPTSTMDEANIEKKVKTYTQNVFSNDLPKATDLDPKAREILERAGINPEDVKSGGDTITRTREEPDGRIITTTYKVRTVPTFNMDGINEAKNTREPINNPGWRYPNFGSMPTRPEYDGSVRSTFPTSSFLDNNGPIEDYLTKVNLSPDDIAAKNGELKKTIVDANGRVLTVSFLLSSLPNNDGSASGTKEPLK